MSNQPPFPPPPPQQGPWPGGSPDPNWYPQQPPPPQGGSTSKVFWTIAAITIAAVLLVVVIVAIGFVDGDSKETQAGRDAQLTGQISGSRDDWLAAVCKMGSFRNGAGTFRFSNATAQGSCTANFGSRPILIGEWDSDYLMRNDIASMRLSYYASAINSDVVIGFITLGPNGDPLEPLSQFGFTVNSLPR